MSIFKDTFKKYVSDQINARQDLVNYNHNNRPIEFNLYTSGKAAWSRMVSLVDYDSPDGKYRGQDLSKKYILQGGSLYNKTNKNNPSLDEYALRSGVGTKNSSYGGDLGNREYGLRPMPGISEIQIKSKTAYGSLREATVDFYAWDRKQLDELEILFMRTGYWVLLEWGWSMYLDTTKYSNVNNLIGKGLKQFDQPTINPFSESLNQEAIYEQLEKLKQKFCGNYDGILGLVRNFSWSMLPNGGFKCTITIISVGEVLDSIKMNSGSSEKLFNDNQSPVKTDFELFLDKLISSQGFLISEEIILDNINTDDMRMRVCDIPFEKSKKSGSIHYIQFGFFIGMLNRKKNFFSGDKTLVKLEIPLPHAGSLGNSFCLASEDSVSIDPEICIIRNSKATFISNDKEGFNVGKNTELPDDYIPDYIRDGFGVIGNIFLSLEYAKDVYLQMLTDTRGDVHVAKYIKNLLEGMSEALGCINSFDLFVNDNKGVIIDKHYCEPDSDSIYNKKFKLNILGTNSVVRSATIQSKIFPNQATLVAIAAGDRENLGNIQTSTNVALNKGLKSRVFQQLSESSQDSILYKEEQERAEKIRFASSISDLRAYVSEYILKRKLPEDSSIKSSASSLLNTLILRVNHDTNYKAIIPITFEFKLDGISGITIGEIFTLNAEALPKDYNDKRIGFIVTGLGATLVRNDWTTDVTAMICLLDQAELKKNKIDIKTIKSSLIEELDKQETQKRVRCAESIVNYNILLAILADYYHGGRINIESANNSNKFPPTIIDLKGKYNNNGKDTIIKVSIPYKRLKIINGTDKKLSELYLITEKNTQPVEEEIEKIFNQYVVDMFKKSVDRGELPGDLNLGRISTNPEDFSPSQRYDFITYVLKSTTFYNGMITEFKAEFDSIYNNTFKAASSNEKFSFNFKKYDKYAYTDLGNPDFSKYSNFIISNVKSQSNVITRDANMRFGF